MNNKPKQYYASSNGRKFGHRFDTVDAVEKYCESLHNLLKIKTFTIYKEQSNAPVKEINFK